MNASKHDSTIADNKLFLDCVTEELIARGFGPDKPSTSDDLADALVFTRDRLAALMSDPRVKRAVTHEVWTRIRSEKGLPVS